MAATSRACARGGRPRQSMGATRCSQPASGRAIIDPMPANDRMPRVCSRRSLLVVLVAGFVTVGSATVLAGCGVQLEEDAPRIPLIPTRAPMKDEQALRAVLARSTALRSLAKAVESGPTSIAGQLSTLHDTQVTLIVRLLRDGGVPESLISAAPSQALSASASPTTAPSIAASPTTASSTHASPTTAPIASTSVLATAEDDSVRDISLVHLSTAHVALIGAMIAQRLAAVTLLGGPTASDVATGPKGAEAVRLLAAARAAVYGFEVVAVQIDSNGSALAGFAADSRLRARDADRVLGYPTASGLRAALPCHGHEQCPGLGCSPAGGAPHWAGRRARASDG